MEFSNNNTIHKGDSLMSCNYYFKNAGNENFIGEQLTIHQRHQIMVEVQVLKCGMKICNPNRLIEEIEIRLLDPHYHPQCGNNFGLKLRAITSSIRDRIWKVPALYLR